MRGVCDLLGAEVTREHLFGFEMGMCTRWLRQGICFAAGRHVSLVCGAFGDPTVISGIPNSMRGSLPPPSFPPFRR